MSNSTATEMASVYDNVTVIVAYLILHAISTSTGEFVSACFNNTQKALHINCGSGNMLRITKAFYGYSNSKACSFQPGDCTQAEQEAYPCLGLDTCNIILPSGSSRPKLFDCDKNSTYFQVEYVCEPVTQTVDICRSSVLTNQTGYISSPRYPNNYSNKLDCLAQIIVHPSQNITLTIIDMDLEINGTYECNDWLYAFNQKKNSVTLCGQRTNEKLITLQSNDISIRFQSDGQVNRKGFWAYYQAYPPLFSSTILYPTTTTIPSTQKLSETTTTTTMWIEPGRISQSLGNNSTETKQKLPFVAIVSGVIGTLTFILITLLILLVYRRRYEKQYTEYQRKSQDVEYVEARNPAFRRSTGATELQGSEIYYNH